MHEVPQLMLRGAIGRDQFAFERVVEFNANELLANWNQRAEYEREQGVVEIWDATGNPVSIVGPYPHTEYYTQRSDRYLGPLRYTRRMVVGVWGSLVIAGPNDTYELRAHGPHGSLERIIRLDRSPVNPDEGCLWVRDYDMPGEDTVWWTVFDWAGAIVTRLETSDRWSVWEIGRDYIVASQVGDLDIQIAVVLSLDRGETTTGGDAGCTSSLSACQGCAGPVAAFFWP